jgi:hypothetical protein
LFEEEKMLSTALAKEWFVDMAAAAEAAAQRMRQMHVVISEMERLESKALVSRSTNTLRRKLGLLTAMLAAAAPMEQVDLDTRLSMGPHSLRNAIGAINNDVKETLGGLRSLLVRGEEMERRDGIGGEGGVSAMEVAELCRRLISMVSASARDSGRISFERLCRFAQNRKGKRKTVDEDQERKKRKKRGGSKAKPVEGRRSGSTDEDDWTHYATQTEAGRKCGINVGSVSHCVQLNAKAASSGGKLKESGGYEFRYARGKKRLRPDADKDEEEEKKTKNN